MFIGLVPSRKNSKRVKNKNLLKFNSITLVERSVNCGKNLDKVIVATNSYDVINILKNKSCQIYWRSNKSASDKAKINLLIDELINEKLININCHLVLLQPTSPLRESEDVDRAINFYKNNRCQPLVSGYIPSELPYKYFVEKSRNTFKPLTDSFSSSAQYLPKYFYPNGAIYIFSLKDYINNNNNLPFDNCMMYKMDPSVSLDIDTYDDVKKLMEWGNVENW